MHKYKTGIFQFNFTSDELSTMFINGTHLSQFNLALTWDSLCATSNAKQNPQIFIRYSSTTAFPCCDPFIVVSNIIFEAEGYYIWEHGSQKCLCRRGNEPSALSSSSAGLLTMNNLNQQNVSMVD